MREPAEQPAAAPALVSGRPGAPRGADQRDGGGRREEVEGRVRAAAQVRQGRLRQVSRVQGGAPGLLDRGQDGHRRARRPL